MGHFFFLFPENFNNFLVFIIELMVLDSERSDECIDFTMMWVITSRNNVPILNFGGGFQCKSEYPWCIIVVKSKHFQTVFKKIEKNKKRNDGKTEIFTQNQFPTKLIFFCMVFLIS
ncbi:Uncharacterized protein FWK35_00029048, partial [Aphis craccivora]